MYRMIKPISEYYVHLDSGDRDAIVYPSTFAFRALCNAPRGTPLPHLMYEFSEVEEFGIVDLVMPAYTKWKLNPSTTNNHDLWIPDTDFKIVNERFIGVNIKEVNIGKLCSTNNALDDSMGILLKVEDDGEKFVTCKSIVSHIFNGGSKEYFKSFTIQVVDTNGLPLIFDHLDNTVDPNIECTNDPLTDKCKLHYPANPLFKDLQFSIVFFIKGHRS